MQFVSVKYRASSAEVGAISERWAQSVGGVFPAKNTSATSIFSFSSRATCSSSSKTNSKFSMRYAKSAWASPALPVTVSIGIAHVTGSACRKRACRTLRARHGASARRRPGRRQKRDGHGFLRRPHLKPGRNAQRCVQGWLQTSVSGPDFKSSRVLIMCHRHPDFDAIGACIGTSAPGHDVRREDQHSDEHAH